MYQSLPAGLVSAYISVYSVHLIRNSLTFRFSATYRTYPTGPASCTPYPVFQGPWLTVRILRFESLLPWSR
jgi:hypothetical protein